MWNRTCFIILHYGTNKELTLRSVESVRNISGDREVDILVVCNGEHYDISRELEGKAETVVLKENLGFSKGNNAGYARARQKNDYDFIIIMNNDVIVSQKDFLDRLYADYGERPFFVAGPDVYAPKHGVHSSPMRKAPYTAAETDAFIRSKLYIISECEKKVSRYGIKSYLWDARLGRYGWLVRLWRKFRVVESNHQTPQDDVVLQGSFFIFSKDFIEVNEKAFEPEVFLYFEEDYLAERCRSHQWKTRYLSDLVVEHYHYGSSNMSRASYREYCEKKIAMSRMMIRSAEKYRAHLLEGERE